MIGNDDLEESFLLIYNQISLGFRETVPLSNSFSKIKNFVNKILLNFEHILQMKNIK